MIRLLFNNLKRTKGMTLLFLLAFAIIFIVTPLALNAIKDTNASIETDITFYSRGSYDVLVRAPEAIQPVEKELSVVPENYLGAGGGGISLAQWEMIKERDDVEIAAPVASLGHYSGVRTSLGVLPEPEKSSRYTVNYYTSDGINKYSFKEYIAIFLESPLQYEGMPDKKFEYLFSRHEMVINAYDVAVFPLPTSHHLLVGIDPVEEEKLTGIIFNDILDGSARPGPGTWMVNNNPIYEGAFAVPVAQLENVTTPFDTKVTIDWLPIDKKQTQALRDNYGLNDQPPYHEFLNTSDSEKFATLVRELIDYPATETKVLEADLNEILRPFNSEADSIFIDENSNLREFFVEGRLFRG